MTISLDTIFDQMLGPLGALVIALFIIYAGYRGWWVWGWYAKELKEENTRLQKQLTLVLGQAKHSTHLAEKNLDLVEQTVTKNAEN